MAENSSKPSILLSCIKCLTKFPSDAFKEGTQICKKCKVAAPIEKCSYCRSDFQQVSKSSICPKCEHNTKKFGKPNICKYCNVKAAFINNKCQRCTHFEKKYGEPVACDHCKQKCAFDRKDEKKTADAKILCWLCTGSYKRLMAKASNQDDKKHQIRVHVSNKRKNSDGTHKSSGPSSKQQKPTNTSGFQPYQQHERQKPQQQRSLFPSHHNNNLPLERMEDQSNVISLLREKTDILERQIVVKDAKLLEKDIQITKLQAEHFTKEQEMINANNKRKQEYDKEVESLHATVKSLRRELARLKKTKNNNTSATNSPFNS